MLEYLALDVTCSSKLSVFLELRSWKPVFSLDFQSSKFIMDLNMIFYNQWCTLRCQERFIHNLISGILLVSWEIDFLHVDHPVITYDIPYFPYASSSPTWSSG